MEGQTAEEAAVLTQAYAEHWVSKRTTSAGLTDDVPDDMLTRVLGAHYMTVDKTLTAQALAASLARHVANREEQRSGWASLSLDELGSIFVVLSFVERKRVAAVCTQWRRAAFRLNDPRQLRSVVVLSAAGPARAELARFLDQSRTIVALGRIGAQRLLVRAGRARLRTWLTRRAPAVRVCLAAALHPGPAVGCH